MTQPNQNPDMNELIAQAAQMQADLQKAQEEILATNVEGHRGQRPGDRHYDWWRGAG